MESIGNNLGSESILLRQMASNAAMKKAALPEEEAAAGNVLATFGDMLKQQMSNINNAQAAANEALQTYAVGGDIELHDVIIAADKASLALDLAMQIRNKIVTAYQEINRMNI